MSHISLCRAVFGANSANGGVRHPFEAKNQAALLIKILRGQPRGMNGPAGRHGLGLFGCLGGGYWENLDV